MITRLRIRNYRGIEALEADIPPQGAVAKGKNGGGKTSILRAIRAALSGQDVGPDAIRRRGQAARPHRARAPQTDAPAELLASTAGIPGHALDGDEVVLDGVRLDTLCGAEQMRFAVEVARRANAKSKLIVVDGLERLDPDTFRLFVDEATRDGYQVIGTRVDAGDVVLEAITDSRSEMQRAEDIGRKEGR